ncbi:hypothetical protein SO802_015427 [Lithocarpus litseifolius]|uniref:Retrotransposon gag domain-containing protein n=1 Tax=Lithocarpus litseifolius TaxID=425828 RepID=A0AAW2CU67_9ROSI
MRMALGQLLRNLLLNCGLSSTQRKSFINSIFVAINWYQSMATNNDKIEKLESEMQEQKESMQKMTTESQYLGSSVREIKEMLSKSYDKSDFLSTPKSDEQGTLSHTGEKSDQSAGFKTTTHNQPRPTKLDFPKYSSDDPTVWLDRVMKYFDYQGTSEDRKVTGTFREYQREFERLANRVDGWPQKALVGAFMGGLKDDIASEIRMFKPKALSEAIELARIRDETVDRQRQQNKADQPQTNKAALSEQSVNPTNTPGPIKKSNKRNCKYKKNFLGGNAKAEGEMAMLQLQ